MDLKLKPSGGIRKKTALRAILIVLGLALVATFGYFAATHPTMFKADVASDCAAGIIDPGKTCAPPGIGCSSDCYTLPGYICSYPNQTTGALNPILTGCVCADKYHDDGTRNCVKDGSSPPCADGYSYNSSSNTCYTQCGNSIIETGESCDDGKTNGNLGDGCSANCQALPGYTCSWTSREGIEDEQCYCDSDKNYHDGGDGKSCVPNGQCMANYHDDGSGNNCVAQNGKCATNYHDDGSGNKCVADSSSTPCIAQYQFDTASKTCKLVTKCGDGITQRPNSSGFNEVCDDGTNNGKPGYCSADCSTKGSVGGTLGSNGWYTSDVTFTYNPLTGDDGAECCASTSGTQPNTFSNTECDAGPEDANSKLINPVPTSKDDQTPVVVTIAKESANDYVYCAERHVAEPVVKPPKLPEYQYQNQYQLPTPGPVEINGNPIDVTTGNPPQAELGGLTKKVIETTQYQKSAPMAKTPSVSNSILSGLSGNLLGAVNNVAINSTVSNALQNAAQNGMLDNTASSTKVTFDLPGTQEAGPIKIDKTAPTITLTDNTATNGNFHVKVADGTSGVDSQISGYAFVSDANSCVIAMQQSGLKYLPEPSPGVTEGDIPVDKTSNNGQYLCVIARDYAGNAVKATSKQISFGPVCGNGVIESGEDCDGANLNGKDCTNYTANSVFGSGTLGCDPTTCKFDTTKCSCGNGNGVLDAGETCDSSVVSFCNKDCTCPNTTKAYSINDVINAYNLVTSGDSQTESDLESYDYDCSGAVDLNDVININNSVSSNS
jgi:cysteine-rich repeat protein